LTFPKGWTLAYYLYITRAAHYARNEELWITLDEWKSALMEDATLEHHGVEGMVSFCAAPGEPQSYLLWKNGNICCANPNPPTVDKLVALAALLGGRVMGEETEQYDGGYEPPRTNQFALFEKRVPDRLRVRFPEKTGYVRPFRPSEKSPESRMPVGFPSAERKPSAAILKLLGNKS